MEVLNNVKLSLGFNLRQPKKIETQTVVYCVIKINEKQIKVPIDSKVYSYQWNKKQQLCNINPNMVDDDRINNISVNQKIFEIKNQYMQLINYLCGVNYTNSEIEETIIEHINNIVMAKNSNLKDSVVRTKKATTIIKEAFNIYCELKDVKESTKKTYEDTLNIFYQYCKDVNMDKESMLTQKGINDYQNYLLKIGKSNTRTNQLVKLICTLVNNVICVHNKFIKEQKRIKPVKPMRLKEIKPISIEEKKRRPLTTDELNKIINCKLDEKLSEFRDLFILQCYCGYRVSDSAIIWNKDNYTEKEINGKKYIMILPLKEEKKDVKAIIWLNDDVNAILNKYKDGFKYADVNSKYFDDKLNENIKKIAKIAGLDSKESWKDTKGNKKEDYLYNIIASHFARYTFIDKCFEMGMNAEEITQFSGHADVSMIKEVYGLRNKDQKFVIADKVISKLNKDNEKVEVKPKADLNEIFNVASKMSALIDALKFTFTYMGVSNHIIKMDKAEQILFYVMKNNKPIFKQYNVDIESFYNTIANKKDSLEKYELLKKMVEELQVTFHII